MESHGNKKARIQISGLSLLILLYLALTSFINLDLLFLQNLNINNELWSCSMSKHPQKFLVNTKELFKVILLVSMIWIIADLELDRPRLEFHFST